MSESFKICPICQTPNHRAAAACIACGTSLEDVAQGAPNNQPTPINQPSDYDFHYGETDLYETSLEHIGQRYMTGAFVLLLLAMVAGLGLVFAPSLISQAATITLLDSETDTPTPRPTLMLPTVTPATPTRPPTATSPPTPTLTATPTREPCIQVVSSGDTLYALALRCGHLGPDVLGLVVELNNGLDSVEDNLQIGQDIIIPWPTTTPDPNAVPTEAPAESDESAANDSTGEEQVSAFDDEFDPNFVPTATLPPGVAFHIVQPDENALSIAAVYGANMEILSQLNPEISFSQCDFGLDSGGPRCTVQIFQGQQIRVPAPTATPTLPPTSTGSETPTPSPTATFNAPVPQSPSNRANFLRDQLITLRWSPTGTLGTNEIYRIRVEDLTDGIVYTVDTRDTFYLVPNEWQGTGTNRHEYSWQVSVINTNDPNNPIYTTETLTFTWEETSP